LTFDSPDPRSSTVGKKKRGAMLNGTIIDTIMTLQGFIMILDRFVVIIIKLTFNNILVVISTANNQRR
jgi:hypothetical protein